MYSLYRTRFNQEYFPYRKEFYYGVTNNGRANYKGSGSILKKYFKKYGSTAFVREDIVTGLTYKQASDLEALIVDEEMLSNPDCLNYQLGGIPFTGLQKEKNPNWGNPFVSPRRMEVLNTETGEIYPSVRAAARHFGVSKRYLMKCLKGERNNPRPIKFV